MNIEKSIEGAIRDAIAAGAFRNLPGEGKPLKFSRQEQALAGDSWLGFKMLENGGYVPEWLNQGKDIETDLEALALLDGNHQEYCDSARTAADWERFAPSCDRLRARYEERARELRKKQDKFNLDAPGIRTQRPAIWVEYHLDRLQQRERAAGRPGPG